MTNLEVKIMVTADKLSFTIENAFSRYASQSHSDVYDLSKLHLEIRVSKIFHKVLNIRSSMIKSPIEIFDRDDFITLGDMLRKLLLEQKILSQNFSNTFKFVTDSPDIRCRIFLEFDKSVHEMAELPWEYIRFENHYLAAHPRSGFDLVRKINLGEEAGNRIIPVPEALNVVVIIADPETPDRALPNEEKTALRDMFSALKKQAPELVNYAVVSSPSRKNLIEKIREAREKLNLSNQPYIIHFYGHAKPDSVALSPGKDNAQEADWVSDTHFAELLDEMVPAEKPAVFIFSACDSGKITQFADNRGVALRMLVQHHLPGVLAMQNEVVSNVAIAFMQEVYQKLLKGNDLAEAVSRGRSYLGNKHEFTGVAADKGTYSNNAFGSPVLLVSTYSNLQFVTAKDNNAQAWVDKLCTSLQTANCRNIEKYPESVIKCKYCGFPLQPLSSLARPASQPASTERAVSGGSGQSTAGSSL